MEPPQNILPPANENTIIVPPPITRTVEALDQTNTQVPGQLKIDKHGNLLKEFLVYDGFSADLISAYNHWIKETLRRQIGSRQLRVPGANGSLVFTKVIYNRPNILPNQCRNRNMTYSFEIEADVAFISDFAPLTARENPEIIGRVSIGKIPIMLGSAVSHMYGKTPDEILAMKECTKDPGGYFIIKGAEKLVIIQEKVRINRILVWVGDKKPKLKGRGRLTCRMTCPTKTGTIVVLLREGESKNIRLSLPFFGKKEKNEPRSIEVLQAFRVLGNRLDSLRGIQDPNVQFSNYENIIEHIMTFADQNPRKIKKILLALQPSLFKATMAPDAVGNTYDYIGRKMGMSADQPVNIKQAGILRGFLNELFPQVNNPEVNEDVIIKQKYDMLAMMVARLIEVMAGARKIDNRDSWSNKRLVSAAGAMEQLFNSAFSLSMNKTEEEIKKNLTDLPITKEALRRVFKFQNDVTENFVSSFNSTNWGIKNSTFKENITEILTRHNMIATYSHLRRINTPTNRKAKQPQVRLNQMSQVGFVCVVETPEGEAVGLVKNLALAGTISIDRDPTIIRELIQPYLSAIRDDAQGYSTKCVLNGIFLGWCLGQDMYNLCIFYRRVNQMFPADTAIVFDAEQRDDGTPIDGTIYIHCDSSRPIRPLLIVGDGKFPLIGEDGEMMTNPDGSYKLSTPERLVIDELNLWDADFLTLLRRGCVEYIDAFEQEYLMLAQSIDFIGNRIDSRRELENRVREAEERYNEIQAGKQIEKEEEIRLDQQETFPTEDEIRWWTLEEAKEELKTAQAVYAAFLKEPPYTHCELDPSSTLSVSASIIPMPDHNQAPRNVYQCVNVTTPILTPSGLVPIKDLKNGDQVISVDPTTRLQKTTRIKNHFIIHPAKYNKQMYRVETVSGRSIEATSDHPFLTERGFVPTEELLPDDACAIFPETEHWTAPNEGLINTSALLRQLLQQHSVPDDVIDAGLPYVKLPLNTIDLETAVIIEWFKAKQHSFNMPLGKWQKSIRYNGQCIYVPLKRSKKIDATLVSDFETEESTHTMIAGEGFVTHNCTMGKQALSIYHSNYNERFDTTAKVFTGLSEMPAGETVTIAFLPWRGWGQEDNFIFNKSAVEQGLFRYIKYITKKTTLKKADFTERFGRPKPKKGEPEDRYENIGLDGLPIVGSVMKQGQCVIGKLTTQTSKKDGPREEENTSVYIGLSEDGIVERVLVTKNEEGMDTVKVRLRQVRSPEAGDKFCLTPDHDVLTENRGWIPIADLTKDDKVATLEESGLVYQHPQEVVSFQHTGEIYHVKSQQVELSVTPDHRMYIKKRGKETFELDLAKNISGKRVNYKKNAFWNVADKEYFDLPATIKNYKGKTYLYPQRQMHMDDWITLFGIWMAEGWADELAVTIASNKPRVVEALTKCCNNLGISSTNYSDKWRIDDRQIADYFLPLSVGATNKSLPKWCFDLSPRQSQLLLQSMMLGDGYVTNSSTWRYFTSSIALANDVSVIALHAGWSANLYLREEAGAEREIEGRILKTTAAAYVLTINRTKNEPQMNHGHTKTQHGQSEFWEFYNGPVYCCTVPSGVFYVRKNGKPVWTGNSPRHAQKGTIGILVDEADMPYVDDPNSPMDGMRPSIIVNPKSIISRMTIGMMIEVCASKPAAMSGERVNATAFRNFDFDELRRNLLQYGFQDSGRERMVDGMTHKPLKAHVFTGPCYYQALRHHVKDKVQMRGKGLINTMTRQPVGGRGRGGGQRVGKFCLSRS